MKLATKGGYELKNGVLRKTVSKKKHLFKMYDGWAVQREILEPLSNDTVIEITDKDEGKVYRATRGDFWQKGTVLDFGHGEQVVLPRQHFV